MPDIRVLLLLVALVPGAVLAQAAAPEPLLAPPLVTAPEEPAFAPGLSLEEVEAFRPEARPYSVSPARVAVEVLGGAGGGVVATLATLIVVNSSDVARLNCRGDFCDGRLIGVLAIAGCGLGSTAAVYGSGELMGGQGRLLPTLVAGLAMGGVGAGLYYAGVGESAEVVIPIMALPMVASIVAYEVSAAWGSSPSHPPAASRPAGATWAPTIALTPRGGTVGLSGRF
jgi:hypothetical protein